MASTAPGGVQQTHPFTCNTCQVAFRSSELQRGHMQSDWHRYNLKRRVASLPPLSSEIFAEKVLANKASAAATAARASYERLCPACQKTYYSENAFINHLASQKHKANVARDQKATTKTGDDSASMMSSTFSLGDPIDTASNSVVDEAAEEEFSEVINGMNETTLEDAAFDSLARRPSRPHHSRTEEDNRTPHPISETATESESGETEGAALPPSEPIKTCLFCNFASPSFALNIHHMTRYHDLFIPEREFLVDMEGLIGYLYAKVTQGHECLYCGKAKHTASGIMTHMRDRGHCKIAFDSEEEQLEIGQFYDFRATYSDPEASDDSDYSTEEDERPLKRGGAKLGAKRNIETTVDGENDEDTAMDDEAGWETDSTLSSVPTDEITAVPIDDHSHRYAELHKSRHHSHSDRRPHKSSDGWHSHAHSTPHAVYYDDFELHLPSGRTAGHRSMNRYWRQNLRSYPSASERAERLVITEGDADGDIDMDSPSDSRALQRGHDRGRQLATVSRANGGLGMVGVTDAKKKEVSKTEKRERAKERRQVERWKAGNERRNNFQKHYRDPLLQ
ncbi:hypothetical protein NA57DRAFT_40046 [Rhizodiscina lignyota]|uniref:C2H2-type domain-containing protein n=1 Tax=Rhizodiscina lignyota TaxID=1504668 RepID=A0A9P4M7Z4_9PEZI|nr:hypothetical protein NA57DRAFT_40046 [Rhizodiscina lignyota]